MRNITRNLKFMESVHLKSLFYYFKLCGMAPVNFNIQAINNAKVNLWTFKHSYSGITYNLLLIFCLSVGSFINMKNNYYAESHWGFDETVYAVVDTFAVCTTLCILLIFSFKQTKLLILFNRVNSVREIIKRNDDLNSEINTFLYKKIVIMLFISAVSWTAFTATVLMYDYISAMSFCAPFLCSFIRNALVLQYCICLNVIADLFDTLNEELCGFSKYLNLPPGVINIDAIEINKKLSQTWEWYSQLHRLSQDVSRFYSFPMLLNILSEFLMAIAITYYVSKPIISGKAELDSLDYANSLVIIFNHVFTMILLTTSVDSAINKSQRTIEMINDYLKEAEIQVIKDKLLNFSIYLLHNNIEFSVFYLFSMDGSLLVSITGSISTYLVILLQFQPPPSAKSTTDNAFNQTAASWLSKNDI